MVALEQLRYVRLFAEDLGLAADFAQRVLGLEPIDRTQELATFRSDFRDHTLAFATGDHAVQCVGLEVRHPEDLDAALEGLLRLGVSAGRGSIDDCALRKVKDMLWFTGLQRQPHRIGGAAAELGVALFSEPGRGNHRSFRRDDTLGRHR